MPTTRRDLERKRLGAWYTPELLVEHLLERTLEPVVAGRAEPGDLRVLDPACGDGRFLVAAARRIAHRFDLSPEEAAAHVWGIDVDSTAIARARAALGPAAHLMSTDALRHDWDLGGYDVIVTNPPFLSQLAAATARGGRSAWGGGPYADTAAVFLALAVRLARPGAGRVGLVLPRSVLATRDAAPIRAETMRLARLTSIWVERERVFDAAVSTCALTFALAPGSGEIERAAGLEFARLAAVRGDDLARRPTWSHLVADLLGVPLVEANGSERVGDRATATAGFRRHFYGIAPFVHDDGPGAPLVTAGAIDPARCRWGERHVRFNGRDYRSPRVDLDALAVTDPRLGAWARQRLVPKVLVANQTSVIEAVADPAGAWFPSVPVISVEPHARADVWPLAAALVSPVAAAQAVARYAGAGLSQHALKLSASQVLDLPLPPAPWHDATQHLRAGDLFRCAELLCALEGASDDVLEWWWERVRRRVPDVSRPGRA